MPELRVVVDDKPHGHGLSYKKGIADGLLDQPLDESQVPETHSASYRRGRHVGQALKQQVADIVRD